MTVGKANTSTDEQMAEYFQRASGEEVSDFFSWPTDRYRLGGSGDPQILQQRERGGGGRERQIDRERERECQ